MVFPGEEQSETITVAWTSFLDIQLLELKFPAHHDVKLHKVRNVTWKI